MTEHRQEHATLERRSDVVVLGAGANGLGAARELSAQGWSVIVLEAGEPDAGADASPTSAKRSAVAVARCSRPGPSRCCRASRASCA
jgi:glycine/D-amino acid oxidase-like deaminating enzyme